MSVRTAVSIFATGIILLVAAPAAHSEPFSQTDKQFLAALQHGGLCCPQQPDTPIWHETPIKAVNTGKQVADTIAYNPTYQMFSLQKDALYEQSRSSAGTFWTRPLSAFEAGEFIVVAVHYYAGAAVECQLMKAMGGAMGEAPYWYGPVTYSGGLAVQPGCINLDR